ncbi:NACHT domain-containing protein [Roseovarius arcticus]|uniref:NACHT domain-containing protein n=1 Tax=Roseovarius arcticus TaxID=2547404 RepID=UPI0011101B29|nr:hypothetical protein [Roseovarius arcticus]
MYINRFLQMDKEDGTQATVADLDFARLQQPKVLLGAPGGGKTEACNEMAFQLNGQKIHAEDVVCGLFDSTPEFEDQLLVIDGLDEVASEEIPKAFTKILIEIKRLGYRNWLVSCRSYEWRSALFDPRIRTAFGETARVAHMGDLSDDEVLALLDNFSFDGDAKQFLKDAEENEATDLLRNPQTLKMLSRAVQTHGWPTTKTELFLSACKAMAAEDNVVHQAKGADRPTPDQIIEAAGWVCVQLLMSGGRAISLGGQVSPILHRPAELASEAYPEESLEQACKTKLFKTAERDNVEPAHRTVAEFLAGLWLAREFRANPRTLSPARVMSYLTFGTGEVPPALRGLHAWTISLDETNRLQNIRNDPYGCLRYGDLSGFSDGEVKALLDALKALSETDPFFRGQDWYTRFGRSLGRISIKEEFLAAVSDVDVSYQLRCTLLDAIQGTDLAAEVADDLRGIVINENATPRERHAAIDVLASSSKPTDWKALSEELLASGTTESLRISLDEIISHNHALFSGKEIAAHIKAYEAATSNEDDPNVAGVGFRISRECSDQQIMEISQAIAVDIPEDPDRAKRGIHKGLEEWLLEFIPRVLSRDKKPAAGELWSLISRLSGYSYRKSDWEKVAQPWFSENDDIRRQIQELALDSAENDSHGWMTFFRLSDLSSGLHLRESDIVHHLHRLIAANDRPLDWLERWKNLVRWAQSHRDFDGIAMELAKEQAVAVPELQPVLDDLLRPPAHDYEAEHREHRRKDNEERELKAQRRHASFTEVRKSIEQGENLGALYDAARASLGHFYEFKESASPKERIAEMAGKENLSSVISGFEAAGNRSDIPSVRDCADLRVRENKVFHLETISLALCVEVYLSGKPLTCLPKEVLLCALSACRWGLHFSGNASEKLQPKLEDVLFKDRATKLNFLKDTIEPGLEVKEEHVSGLHRATTEEQFADVLPELAVEWLERFEQASEGAVWSILKAAVRFVDRSEIADLVETRIQKNEWASDEHRRAWHAAAFALDFSRFHSALVSFADDSDEHLWAFKAIVSNRRTEEHTSLQLSVEQLHFLVDRFALRWPVVSPPSSGWSGSHNGWDATNWIHGLINLISDRKTKDAIAKLRDLADSGRMGDYQNHVLHALANARRAFAETHHSTATLGDVRSVLLSGKPTNVSDLQILFLEALEIYQTRIRTGQTDTYLTYWEGDKPHIENYCRDRLLDGLEQPLENYGVRVHKEGAMANETRVDLLLTCDDFDLPVEIKRQWHANVWSAASEQLEAYSENYRTDGTGVYLVIWHGPVVGKTIPKPSVGERPNDAEEMLEALSKNQPRELSSATKIVVLDVSKPQ